MSRRRSAERGAARRELLRSLLRHGARFQSPAARVLAPAEELAGLGVADLQRLRTVRCANPHDGDFPPLNRHCDGLIDLRPVADEGSGDYRCPACERIVFPTADRKRQFDSLVVHLRQAGIEAFLIDRCGEAAIGRVFVGGLPTLPLEGINGFVCIVDYCTDERWYRRSTAAGQPCVYVTVGPDKASQILDEDAIARVELVDILLGTKDLQALLTDRAGRGPALFANVDVSVYALGARPIAPESRERAEPRRVFHLCVSPEGLLVDGLLAIRAGRTVAMAVMGIFMQRFMDAAMSGGPVKPITAKDLANALDPRVERFEDADSIARHIPRMRESIIDTVRQQTGQPIGEHDIIETVSRSGSAEDADGYRLNPRTVALGPLEL